MKRDSKGFTLVELLVVIGILGLLMAVLLPQVLEAQQEADIFADKANLKWHHANIEIYKNKKYKWPKGGGHKFVLAPWVKRVVQHTKQNRDRYFVPGLETTDERWGELDEEDPKTIWQGFPDVSSWDTHYAGLDSKHYRKLKVGDTVIMCTDNEGGAIFQDGTINVLLASGSIETLSRAEALAEYWEPDDPEFYIEVGENSPVPMLQTVAH